MALPETRAVSLRSPVRTVSVSLRAADAGVAISSTPLTLIVPPRPVTSCSVGYRIWSDGHGIGHRAGLPIRNSTSLADGLPPSMLMVV